MTWNAADKSADVVLSNSDLTATLTTSFNEGVRGINSHSAGLRYLEYTIVGFDTDMTVGVAEASHALTDNTSSDAATLAGFGNVGINGGSFADGLTFTTSDVISCVVDFTNKRIWFRVNGGNWNGSGTANPATNVGGHDMTFLSWVWTDLFPYAFLKLSLAFGGSANDAVTINETGPFAFTMPSGATAWTPSGSTESGTLASTEAADTASLAGTVTNGGTWASTGAADTASLAGTIAHDGAWSSTGAADTASIAGRVPMEGPWASTGTPDTLHFSGTDVGDKTGTWASTETTDICFMAEPPSGGLLATENADSFAASGTGIHRTARRILIIC